jgi:nucleoside-diphosphate-sugar epimerase
MKFFSYGMTGYVGVWDVVKAMVLLMESSDKEGERYLVTAENLTYKEVFDMVAEALGKTKPNIEGTLFMTELAWRLDWFKSKLLRLGNHTFTKERVRAARNVTRFDNNKIKEALGIEFEPIEDVIKKVAESYRSNAI